MVVNNNAFLCGTKWRNKREKILKRDNYQCQLSKRYGKNVPAQVVHHIFPRSEFPEYALSDWNLISLSLSVHEHLHNKDGSLNDEGIKLAIRTARKNKIPIPEKFF